MAKQQQNRRLSNNRFWNFAQNQNNSQGDSNVELRIEGDIVDSEDIWIYEWFGIPAAAPNAFRAQLAEYAGQNITVWIDSCGGSVYAAAGIYTALMEHQKDGATVSVKIDSKAMSAATIIAMAGRNVMMSPLATFMIHEPLMQGIVSGIGYADDHLKTAAVLNEVKETIINAYESKTGLPRDEIAALMKDETYMSAQKAVDLGFADEILYTDDGDKSPQALNFSFRRSDILNLAVPVEKLFEIEKIAQKTKPVTPVKPPDDIKNSENGGNSMEIKNSADLKAQLPTVHDEIYNAGVAAERTRLQAFDVISDKVDPEFLAAEKYKDGTTAESVLFNAMKDGKMLNTGYVAQAEQDAQTANSVPGTASDNVKPDEVANILSSVKNIAEKAVGKVGNK